MNNATKEQFMAMFDEMLNETKDHLAFQKMTELKTIEKGDEVDLVNDQKEMSLQQRLGQRNILFLKKVESAKQKILDGTYGYCEECDGEISQKRLLARPTACLCIDCQEDKEKGEFQNFNKRRDLEDKKISNDSVEIGELISTQKKFSAVKDISFESVID